jgi:hypothetical protein
MAAGKGRRRSLRLVLKSCDLALALPKFDVMTVNQVLGVLFRGVVIGTKQLDRSDEAPVDANDIGSVFRHGRLLIRKVPDKEQESASGSVHFGPLFTIC